MATIKSSGGDYTTVALWEADTDNNLSGAGEVIGEIYDVNPTAALVIAGATNTSASDFRHLTVNSAYRHAGVWDTGKCNFQASSGTTGILDVAEAFGKVSYQQVKNTHATGPSAAIKISNVASAKVHNCIGWTTTATAFDDNAGLYVTSAGSTSISVRNCVFYTARRGMFFGNASQTATVENCTVGGCTLGITSSFGAALTIKNCYAGGNSSDDYNEGGSAGWSSWTATTCMCADSITETGLTASIAFSTSNFTNVTAGSYDFSLPSGSGLIDQGTDLSGTFTIDIAGATRGATWDIGAFEFVAAGGDPEGRLIGGKLLRGGLLHRGVLVG